MKKNLKLSLALVGTLNLGWMLHGANPIIQTIYTADPAPLVHGDTLYLYTTHDEQTDSNFFTMRDWQVFSTNDLVNWTAHGTVASLQDLEWTDRDNGAWAPQCIERNGKFYLYVPIHGGGIGVLVADTPYGPFKDALGRRFIESAHIWDDIDPAVFVDHDGQAYLYWGNPKLMYVKLNEDMISFDTSIGENGIVYVDMTAEAFGPRIPPHEKYATSYEEGPWLYFREGMYYLFYPAEGLPEVISYSTAPTATGPWTYQGVVMGRHPGLAFTNHPGVVDYKGKTLFFYHDETLPGGGGFNRSVCVEEMEFDSEGKVIAITPTREGILQGVGTLNPYTRVEAETIAVSSGVTLASEEGIGVYVTGIHHGDFIRVRDVAFTKGTQQWTVRAASLAGGSIEIRLGQSDGPVQGVCAVAADGSDTRSSWQTFTCELKNIEGVHDLYLVFRGADGSLFDFDWWQFEPLGNQ
jgi:arabinoxylan arabinofuranohydrolase